MPHTAKPLPSFSVDHKVVHCLTPSITSTHTVVVVLTCVKLPHELGKDPVMLLLLMSSWRSCSTATKLIEP